MNPSSRPEDVLQILRSGQSTVRSSRPGDVPAIRPEFRTADLRGSLTLQLKIEKPAADALERNVVSNTAQLILQELNELLELPQIQIGNGPPLHA